LYSQLPRRLPERIPSPAQKPIWRNNKFWFWSLLFIFLLGLSILAGAAVGYQYGIQFQAYRATQQVEISLEEQYNLGLQDLAEGRYEVARQRFEYIIAHDPSFPGITDKLADSMAVLYSTATPTPPLPTITTTPTPDLRPVEDLYKHSLELVSNQSWNEAIDTLLALRKADQNYRVARVDGLLFISLRQRGFDKIWKERNLEGGSYDLALAEGFGPLDAQAVSSRELARLYMIGSSFWEVYPEQAVNYFGQVAAAAPGLQDASGWTASERYRESLIQYGDQLATSKDWCNAQKQYELALAIRADVNLEATRNEVALKCSPPTSTPQISTPTATILSGLSPTPSPPIVLTSTNTVVVIPPTNSPTLPIIPTTEAPPPIPTNTLPPLTTDTPIPTSPTDTPIPAPPTDTPIPPPPPDTPIPPLPETTEPPTTEGNPS
jgi:tetratricopeptide (TPR) repeat protein